MATRRSWILPAALAFLLLSPPATAASDELLRVALPRTVAIDEELREMVEESAAVSPTLQRQFAAIAGAAVIVEVRVSLAPLLGLRRAEASISHYDSGFVRARIVLPSGVDFIELLAHELEHVLEQVERVDLAELARSGAASRDGSGSYETVRAHDAGRAAASEVEQGLRALNQH